MFQMNPIDPMAMSLSGWDRSLRYECEQQRRPISMKLPAFVLLFCLSTAFCHGKPRQPPPKNTDNNATEVFDQRTFDEHKTSGHYVYSLPDGTEIEQWETPGKDYLEEIRKGHSNYSTYRLFYFGSKRLMKKGEQFFKIPIGIWKTYDEAGGITEEVDHERGFKVSVHTLEKIMADMGINISVRSNGVGVVREESPRPAYTVFVPGGPGGGSTIRFIQVDGGVTGKIISQMLKRRTKD